LLYGEQHDIEHFDFVNDIDDEFNDVVNDEYDFVNNHSTIGGKSMQYAQLFETAAFGMGRAFFVNDYATLAGTGNKKYMITSPNDNVVANMCFSINATADVTVAIFEGADRTGGTALTAYNVDRNSAFTSSMVVAHTPTGGTTDGTQIKKWATPTVGDAFRRVGWSSGEAIQLKRGTKYCVVVTDVAGGCNISTTLTWIEQARFMFTTTTTTTSTTTSTTTTTAP
jgi:hypothetical protein